MLFPVGVPLSKRLFDLLLTSLGMVIISPLLLALALSVWLLHGSPVLFRQKRPGYRSRPFMNLKFRTMTDKRDAQGNLLPDAERLTRLGRVLRSTSLDELPELINVLRGEMSLVGPRPLLMQYLERYTPEQSAPSRRVTRHDRLGAGQWAQCAHLGGKIPPGCLVCRPLVALAGRKNPAADFLEGGAPGGHQPGGACLG